MKEKKKKRSKSMATEPKSSSLVRPLILRHSNPPAHLPSDPQLQARLQSENEQLRADLRQLRTDEADILAQLHKRLEEKDHEVAELEERLGRLKRRRAAEVEETENSADQLRLDLAQSLAENRSLKLRLGALEDVERARQSLAAELTRLKGRGSQERATWEARLKRADRDAQSRIQRLGLEMASEVESRASQAQAEALQKAQEHSASVIKENASLRAELAALSLELSGLRSANLHLQLDSRKTDNEPLEMNNNALQGHAALISKLEEDREKERLEGHRRVSKLEEEIDRLHRVSAEQDKEVGRLREANVGLESAVAKSAGRLERILGALKTDAPDRLASLTVLAETLHS